MTYEMRVVVFIDILGFKSEIESTVKDGVPVESQIKILQDTLFKIGHCLDPEDEGIRAMFGYESIRSSMMTQFSDSIVASIRTDDPAEIFKYLIVAPYFISRILINDAGLTCRGGVSLGYARHNSFALFGPGLIQAYRLESEVAKYPRIVIHPDVFSMLETARERILDLEGLKLEDVISLDHDGVHYINYFKNLPKQDEDDWINYQARLQKVVNEGLQKNDPGVISKYMWMRSKIASN
jgi:hypothetical protein